MRDAGPRRAPIDESASHADFAFVTPFLVFVAFMAVQHAFDIPAAWFCPVRLLAVSGVLIVYSRPFISLRASAPLASAAIGAAAFLIWIGPDVLFGPGYRHFWLFNNFVTGSAVSSAPDSLKGNLAFIVLRVIGSTALVPVVEELFWRGWLMRWLIHYDFLRVPLGSYTPLAFWTVVILFASEHGPYWEVGLAAGIIYNWWLVRTRNLADCILAHAVTNGLLSAYVLTTGHWQYWL